MSNATVSSQVYILRNAGGLAAVSSGTMILYADGTHLFAKDANGNVYNLCNPSGANITMAFNDLTDATISSPQNNEILHYQGNQWVNVDPQTALAEVLALADLSNVHDAAPSDGQVLVWNASQNRWEPGTVSSSSVANLGDIGNVTITSPASGASLVYDSTNNIWIDELRLSTFNILSGSTTVSVDTTNNDFTLTGGSGIDITPNSSTRVFTFDLNADSDDLNEGSTNLFFTTARVDTHLNVSGASANQILSWDGTDYAWVADQTGTGSGSPGGAQYDVQINDGSGGFSDSNWKINANYHFLPDATVTYDVGGPAFATRRMFVGTKAASSSDDGGLYLAKATNASQLSDYAKICTDGTHGKMYFEALADGGNVHHYYFEDVDGSVELHLNGNGSHYWTLKTDSGMSQSQTLKLPQAMGTNGQVLALSGVTSGSDNADLDWTTINASPISTLMVDQHMFVPTTHSFVPGSGSVALTTGKLPPYPSYVYFVYSDSAPDTDSSVVIKCSPTFQVKPTMEAATTTLGGSLTFVLLSGAFSSAAHFQVILTGTCYTTNGALVGTSTGNIQCAFTSGNPVATTNFNNAALVDLMPATIMAANNAADDTFRNYELKIQVHSFAGQFISVTGQDLVITGLTMFVKQ